MDTSSVLKEAGPAHPAGCPVIDLDHHAPAFTDNLDANLSEIRERCPVAFNEAYGGYFLLTRFEDVRRVLLDDETFSVERDENGKGGLLIPEPEGHHQMLLPGEYDAPRHTRYRAPLIPMFTKRKVNERRDALSRIVSDCLDAIDAKDGDFDIVNDLTNIVSAQAIMEYLGFPSEERDEFRLAIEVAFGVAGRRYDPAEVTRRVDWMNARIESLVQEKRADKSGGDLMSHLANMPDESFTDEELFGFVMNQLLGAIVTTSAATSNALVLIDSDPELRRRLLEHPEIMPGAADEFIRLGSPAMGLARTVMRDVEVDGVPMKKGDRVYSSLRGANYDEAQFPDATVVDPTRRGSHIAFGHGAHFCTGVHLARLEVELMISQVLERYPDFEIIREGLQPVPDRGVLSCGWATVPTRKSALKATA